MTHYIAFLKKELIEGMRTYKILIMFAIFLMFGIISPLGAKLIPQLIESLMPEGAVVIMPIATALDSWQQFFKNITQMGFIIILIIFNGILGAEIMAGTLIIVLTKGLSRKAVILSKYTYMVLIWTSSLLLSFLVTWIYTTHLFLSGEIHNLLFAVFCLWLFGVLLLALLIFSSTLINASYGRLLLIGAIAVLGLIANVIPNADKYNPLSLSSKNMDLLTQTIEKTSMYSVIGVSLASTIILIVCSILIFRKKHL